MFRGFRRVGKVGGVPFEEGGMGEEAIKRVGGVVDIRLSNFPPNGGLVSELVSVVWVFGGGKGYGLVRCGWVRIGWSG